MNGIIVVNKPINYTSRDIVNKLCKVFNTKKIGHTGTLDPLATGVLVVAINRYTKLVDELTSLDKEYIATIKLGVETDTLDITGKIEKEDTSRPRKDEVIKVLTSFMGDSLQEVPKYSAIKKDGKKLYEYARNNIDIELPKHKIKIFDIELLSYEKDEIIFRVLVSKGTYIRSLIRDICHKLDTVGTMKSLIRTKQGSFNIENSYSLDHILHNKYDLLTLKDVFSYQKIDLSTEDYQKVINGNKIKTDLADQKVILYYQNEEIAIYEVKDKIMKPVVMIKINEEKSYDK